MSNPLIAGGTALITIAAVVAIARATGLTGAVKNFLIEAFLGKRHQSTSYSDFRRPESDWECCICLTKKGNGFNNENIIRPFSCEHPFHQLCIKRIIEDGQKVCPYCRCSVTGSQ